MRDNFVFCTRTHVRQPTGTVIEYVSLLALSYFQLGPQYRLYRVVSASSGSIMCFTSVTLAVTISISSYTVISANTISGENSFLYRD